MSYFSLTAFRAVFLIKAPGSAVEAKLVGSKLGPCGGSV